MLAHRLLPGGRRDVELLTADFAAGNRDPEELVYVPRGYVIEPAREVTVTTLVGGMYNPDGAPAWIGILEVDTLSDSATGGEITVGNVVVDVPVLNGRRLDHPITPVTLSQGQRYLIGQGAEDVPIPPLHQLLHPPMVPSQVVSSLRFVGAMWPSSDEHIFRVTGEPYALEDLTTMEWDPAHTDGTGTNVVLDIGIKGYTQ